MNLFGQDTLGNNMSLTQCELMFFGLNTDLLSFHKEVMISGSSYEKSFYRSGFKRELIGKELEVWSAPRREMKAYISDEAKKIEDNIINKIEYESNLLIAYLDDFLHLIGIIEKYKTVSSIIEPYFCIIFGYNEGDHPFGSFVSNDVLERIRLYNANIDIGVEYNQLVISRRGYL